jgi:hypothetical protein
MTNVATHQYEDIYDPFGAGSTCNWFVDDDGYGRWRYYEGYGRGDEEKKRFLKSIKEDHGLWSDPTDVSSPNTLQGGSTKEIGVHFLGAIEWAFNVKDVSDAYKSEEKETFLLAEGVHEIDGNDRVDRISWNFSQMLAEYVEKNGIEDRKNFFNYGGYGKKWSKNKSLMVKFGEIFDGIAEKIKEDPEHCISLSDISVKSYPRSHFYNLKRSFKDYMDSGSKLRATVSEFVPTLQRLTVRDTTDPVKPCGPPPPRRPTASSKDSTSFLCWAMKQEMDYKMGDLDKKIDLLIAMNGPIVEAHNV